MPCSRIGGGLKALALIDPDDLAEQPEWYLECIIEELSFLSGKSAYLFEQDMFSGQLTAETDTANETGDFFTYNLSAFFRNKRPDVDFLRSKLMNRRVHVIATYIDGSQRFLPFMRLRAREESGSRRSEKQGYGFSGQCTLIKPAPWVNGVITGTPGGGEEGGGETTNNGVTIVSINTSAASYSYAIPTDILLVAVYVRSNSAQEVSLGTTAGGTELGGPIALGVNEYALLGDNLLRTEGSTNIYLSGLAGDNTIEIWLLGGEAVVEPPAASGQVLIIPITTTDPDYTYAIASGYLLTAVYMKSTNAQTVSVGTSPGESDLAGPIDMEASEYALLGDNLLRTEGSTNIYFSGMAGTNTIELWLLG